MIGGQHRYAVDQYGGGRHDRAATAAARCWWAANVAAAGLPMMFMGTEAAQSGWWDTDQWHGMNWDNTQAGGGDSKRGRCFVKLLFRMSIAFVRDFIHDAMCVIEACATWTVSTTPSPRYAPVNLPH